MIEAETLQAKLATARSHPEYARAMAAEPPTSIVVAVVVAAVMALSLIITFAVYPWDSLHRMPDAIKMVMMLSWVPTLGAAAASAWLLVDALGLAMAPTRRELAVIARGSDGPAPYMIRLVGADGAEREYRAKRRAASVVKLRLLVPGDVGVALFKGDRCLEWVALPATDRIYDRR